MNKKMSTKKLKLNTETVRHLAEANLKEVAGGITFGSCPCRQTEAESCWC